MGFLDNMWCRWGMLAAYVILVLGLPCVFPLVRRCFGSREFGGSAPEMQVFIKRSTDTPRYYRITAAADAVVLCIIFGAVWYVVPGAPAYFGQLFTWGTSSPPVRTVVATLIVG